VPYGSGRRLVESRAVLGPKSQRDTGFHHIRARGVACLERRGPKLGRTN
jgi:hypothetical protein